MLTVFDVITAQMCTLSLQTLGFTDCFCIFFGENVYDIKASNYVCLKTNIFAVAKVFTVSNKMKQHIVVRVIV